ncbi:TonB-dependent receptor domain-containing protein [Helicobacter apodemus]
MLKDSTIKITLSSLLLSQVLAMGDSKYVLDTSVVSASGFLQDVKDAPATINVISKEELSTKPYRDITEAIADIPGVDLFASKGKTGNYNITMRGITGYTLILVDGRRQGVGGEVGPNGFNEISNAFLPPLSAIERIEVIKGPMSTLYGSEALGGVINIITKKVSKEWGLNVQSDGLFHNDSSWGNSYSASLYGSGPLAENLGLALRYRQFHRQGSNVQYTNSTGQIVPANQAQSPTRANNFNAGAKLTYLPTPEDTIVFDIDYSKNSYNNKSGQLGTLTSPLNSGGLTGGYTPKMNVDKIVTYLTHQGTYNNFNLDSGLQYNRVTNNGREVVGQATQKDLGHNRDIKAEDIIIDTKAIIPIGERNILSLGGEYKLEKMRDKIATPNKFDQYLLAVFAEDEFSILENLNLTLGGRYNRHEIFGNNFSPRGYLVFNPNKDLTLKGGVATGFKAPYANRLIAGEYNYGGQGRYPIYGNPNLKEETSINYEASAIYNQENYYLSLTGYFTKFKDKISSTRFEQNQNVPSIGVCSAQRCFQAINHGKVDYKGIELAAGITPAPNLSFDLAYTYTDNKVKESDTQNAIGKPESGSLKHNLMGKATYKILKTTPYLKAEYQGNRFRDPSEYSSVNRYYKNVFLLSLGLGYEINKDWHLNMGVYNLLNKNFTQDFIKTTSTDRNGQVTETWYNAYNRVEEGRRYWLSLSANF